jgi:outer membrane protein
MISKKLLHFTSAMFLCFTLDAKETYTLDELILQAMQNSPNLQISSYEANASKSRYDNAFGKYLPQVDLHLSAGSISISDTSNPNSDKMIDDTLIKGVLSAKQIIYDFGKTGGNADKYKYESQSYKMLNSQNISDKIRYVKSAYYDVLKSVALIEVNIENVKLNDAQLYRAKKYFEAGIRTKIDVSDAKVRLIQAQIDLRNAEYNLKLAYASLDKVIGFSALENDYNVYTQKLNLTNIYTTLSDYHLSLPESIKYAYANRYSLKQYDAQIKSTLSQKRYTESSYYPSVYLNADYVQQDTDKLQYILPKEQWQASVNLDWNIYEGGSTSARTQEQELKVMIAKSKLNELKLSVKKEVTQAYVNLYKIKDSVGLSQKLLEVSAEKFDQASKRYEHGLSDYIELQEARQGYISAKASLVVDYYNYYNAIAILNNAIGQ